MALSRSEIFLTFTIAVLTVFSICLGKCYLSEKNEKLTQINLNARLNIEKNRVDTENQRLQERNVELGGGKLVRLQEINNRIEELQNQVREQLNICNGADGNIVAGQDEAFNALTRVAGLNNEIKNLHNEFLSVSFTQISSEARVEVYRHHNEKMKAFLDQIEIIAKEGLVDRKSVDLQCLRTMIDGVNSSFEDELNEINDKIQQLEERQKQNHT